MKQRNHYKKNKNIIKITLCCKKQCRVIFLSSNSKYSMKRRIERLPKKINIPETSHHSSKVTKNSQKLSKYT